MHELHEFELEGEGEFELESGEQFFGKIFKGIGRFVKKAAPILKSVAKVAAPMVGQPSAARSAQFSASWPAPPWAKANWKASSKCTSSSSRAKANSSLKPKAKASRKRCTKSFTTKSRTRGVGRDDGRSRGARTARRRGRSDGRSGGNDGYFACRPAGSSPHPPHLVRGTAILTRVLRRRRATRPAVRAVPTIIRRTVNSVKRQAAAGKPITRKTVARAAASQVRKVLGSPRLCTAAIAKNVARAVKCADPRRKPRHPRLSSDQEPPHMSATLEHELESLHESALLSELEGEGN